MNYAKATLDWLSKRHENNICVIISGPGSRIPNTFLHFVKLSCYNKHWHTTHDATDWLGKRVLLTVRAVKLQYACISKTASFGFTCNLNRYSKLWKPSHHVNVGWYFVKQTAAIEVVVDIERTNTLNSMYKSTHCTASRGGIQIVCEITEKNGYT